eukprot:TRINITY_DN6092_c0_g1_i2.p1 TRINITY_DN6092_c0_g1~~TRINITY_DN6092_c0_g1_i2.p1  ORF type:complete len:378 (+),score=121.33 TRINITY_DN6092_c0_g1_i2:152-1135(+)
MKINSEDHEGRTPLHLISKEVANRTEVTIFLVKKGANLNHRDRRGFSPLHVAVKNNDDLMTRVLISLGAELNSQDEEGSTPLHLALMNKCEKTIQILLSGGANVHISNAIDGSKPLHLAVYSEVFTAMLICCGADLHSKNKEGNTPLHVAAESGNVGVAICLVNAGCDINSQSNRKANTPLHLAVIAKHENMALVLTELGANLSLLNKDNNSPLSYAKSKFKSLIQEAAKKRKEQGSQILNLYEASKMSCIYHKTDQEALTQKIFRVGLTSMHDLKQLLLSKFNLSSVGESGIKFTYCTEMGNILTLSDDVPLTTIKIAREIHLHPN